MDQVYTDIDNEVRLEIIRGNYVIATRGAKTYTMDVKVDPCAEANLIAIPHFRALFLKLCHNGQPLEGVLASPSSRYGFYSNNNIQASHDVIQINILH